MLLTDNETIDEQRRGELLEIHMQLTDYETIDEQKRHGYLLEMYMPLTDYETIDEQKRLGELLEKYMPLMDYETIDEQKRRRLCGGTVSSHHCHFLFAPSPLPPTCGPTSFAEGLWAPLGGPWEGSGPFLAN